MQSGEPRAAIYTRVSKDRTGLALSVGEQELNCRRLCADRGWSVSDDHVYEDNDISASRFTKKTRPGYTAMMQAVADGQVDAIVSVNADRLYRRLSDLVEFTAIVQRAHTLVATTSSGDVDLNTGDGVAAAGHLGVAAQHQSDRASERQRDKQRQLAREGHAHGRSFGINDDGVSLNEAEAQIIREVAENIINGGSVRSQCQWLNSQGILTERGNVWLPTSLRRLLKSARIAGWRDHHGVLSKAQWPGIITQVQRAQLLARFSAAATPGRQPVHLLSGVLKCGKCNTGMVRAGVAYVCPAPPRGCQKVSIAALASETYVISELLAHADLTPLKFKDPAASNAVAEEIARDRATVSELAAGIANGTLSIALAQSAAATIESRIAENMVALASQADSPVPVSVNPEAGREFHLRDYWEEDFTSEDGTVVIGDTDIDERRWIIRARIASITVLPSTVRRTFSFNPARLRITWRDGGVIL